MCILQSQEMQYQFRLGQILFNDIMGAQRATIEALVEAMGEEAGLSFAYQKYFGDK